MGGTIVLTLIEALLILLALLISKAIRFISPSLDGDQLVAANECTQDDVMLTQRASPPSSHIVVSPPAIKYDVFLSFRGEDTRHTFATYLYKGLCNAGIHTFMDYELRKGENISQVLLRTIEESEISMIIFSDNYASSTWCLDELVHILECKENFGRMVIPIFYNIDPSNIRKQNGRFGNGFYELKQRFKDNPKKLQRWRNALIQSASFSGWDSNYTRPEFKLVEEIVKDTLSKLNNKLSPHLEGLVGIAHHIENVGKLLSKARIVGIWGMGGAGKTTLAKAIFQVLKDQFDAFSFIENVEEQLARITLDELQQNCLKELLKDKDISIYDIKSTYVKNRLGRKKILLMLDDVDNAKIAADLTEVLNWFGEGSRIIIISRDMRVLQNASALSTYHVPNLDFHDAIHLFSLKAFKQHEPSEGYIELSKSVVEYCQGNPLALTLLGCFLYGREKEDWGSALEKLNQDPPKDIVDVLKLSFDGLDGKQQNVFLDLTFFINERVYSSLNLIRQLYDSSVAIDLSVLREKSLISFDHRGGVVMHDLVKKMGLEIARQQLLFTNPGSLVRLWKHEDIDYFFSCGKEMEAIRCMSLDVSKLKKITVRASSFQKMHNLIFLKIYKSDRRKPSILNIRGVLDYLPKELRFLSWKECPLSYVPLHFCAKNLITLKMRNSNIQQLWKGNEHFPNLEKMDLSHSEHLIALPDLSNTPKIKELNLKGCVNLSQIHSSTLPVNGLGLNMKDCGVVQIKVGGRINRRSSASVMVGNCLKLQECLFEKSTMEVFKCGNMIWGVRFKHEVMPLEEIEELRKLGSLLPFVWEVQWFEGSLIEELMMMNDDMEEMVEREEIMNEWLEGPIESGHDFNQHFGDVDKEERGNRGEMMNGRQVRAMSSMEDDTDDDVLMEDCCSESVIVIFTRVPNSITRWSLLTQLTLKSLPLSDDEYHRRIKPRLDVTLSFPDAVTPSALPSFEIHYDLEGIMLPRDLNRFCDPLHFSRGLQGPPNGPPRDYLDHLGSNCGCCGSSHSPFGLGFIFMTNGMETLMF